MVIYKFIEIPSEEYKDRLSELGMNAYKLYAYTNDKKLRKKFKNTRDMNLFAEIKTEMSEDEFVKFANLNNGYMLKEYEYEYLRSYKKSRLDEPDIGVCKIVSTWFERESSDDLTENASTALLGELVMNPFVFNRKYLKALNDLQFISYWKMYGRSVEESYQYIENEDIELLETDIAPEVSCNMLDLFLDMYGYTFKSLE